MKALGAIAAALVGLYVAFNIAYPTYTYRYRLTITVEIDGKIHTGSSVIEVSFRGQPYLPGVGSFIPHIRGQAVFIDLGRFGTAIAVLIAPSFEQGGTVRWPEGVSALWLATRAFGIKATNDELPQLPHLAGRRDLTPDNMPRLIWFSHLDDPKTARRFKVENIPTLFGPSARLAAAYVEITNDPIVIDIDKKLPWYETLTRPLGQGLIEIEYGFALSKGMFIGDAS
jgi:hypothetical protein